MDEIAKLLQMILPFLGSVKGLPEFTAHALSYLIGMGLIIESVEVIALLTATKKDDVVVAKIKVIKNKIISVLEVIPHANIPVASWLQSAAKWLAKGVKVVQALLAAWKDK